MGTTTVDRPGGTTTVKRPSGSTSVQKPLSGPLVDHLHFLADDEDWTAGDPLPNHWIDNSGIQDLTDNNGVEVETASPIIGSKSVLYDRTDPDFHSTTTTSSLSEGGRDLFVGAWIRLNALPTNTSTMTIQSRIDPDSFVGWRLWVWGGDDNIYFTAWDQGGSKHQIQLTSGGVSTGTTYMVEGWWLDGTAIKGRVDDGSVTSSAHSASLAEATSQDYHVGQRSDGTSQPLDGVLENVTLEIADPGGLEWPSDSTWRYNSGAGRSWSEIKPRNA